MNRKGYLLFSIAFLAPAFVVFTWFFVIPVFMTAYLSLTDMGVGGPRHLVWLANYRYFFTDPAYWTIVLNNLKLVGASLLFQIPPGMVLAYLVSRTRIGYKAFRAVYFLPIIISDIAIGLMFSLALNGEYGLVNAVLERVGLGFLRHNWLSEKGTVLASVIGVQVWQHIGFHFVVLLAGIMTIPDSLMESAVIDGASSTRIFFQIVVPLSRGFLQVCVVLTITGCLRAFGHAWAMTGGGPGIRTTYPSILMFKTAFEFFRFGRASAVAIVILLMALVASVTVRKLLAAEAIDYSS